MNMTDIQRPLSSNDLGDPWLLYDKNRSHVEQRTEGFINEQLKAAMGDAPKGYFQAEWPGRRPEDRRQGPRGRLVSF
jgi:hypothetical protein